MELNKLKKNTEKKRKRRGRGQGSGIGGTSKRGHKGAKSRSGYKKKRGFEGGQLPLQRRIPKFGFKKKKIKYKIINIYTLNKIAEKEKGKEINKKIFKKNGLINNNKEKIKILGKGELKHKINIFAHSFSKKSIKNIKQFNGNINYIIN